MFLEVSWLDNRDLRYLNTHAKTKFYTMMVWTKTESSIQIYRLAEYYSTTPKPDWYDNYRDISVSKGLLYDIYLRDHESIFPR